MREVVRLSQLKLNWSMGHLYTVSGVQQVMRSQGLIGRIAEREEHDINSPKKPSAMVPRNKTECDDRFRELGVD